MNFKLMCLSIFLSISSFVLAMEQQTFKMPEEKKLLTNLKGGGFNNVFILKTGVLKNIAGKELGITEIVSVVDTSLNEYNEFLLKNPLPMQILAGLTDAVQKQ